MMMRLQNKMFRTTAIIIIILFISGLILNGCSSCIVKRELLSPELHQNWTMFGGDDARTHRSHKDLKPPLKLLWRESVGSAIEKTLLAADGILYFGTKDGRIFLRDIHTGEDICSEKMTYAATCCYANHHLYVARRYGNNTLYDLNLTTGKYDWKIDAGDIASEPLITSNSIIVTALYKHIDLYTLESGVKIWSFETDDQIRSSPARAGSKVIFGCDDGFVYAVSYDSGNLQWKYETNGAVIANPVIDIKNNLALIGSSDFNFYALDLENGNLVWKYSTDGQILNGGALSKDKIIFSSNDKNLYCLHVKTGEKIWTARSDAVIGACPLISGEHVFWGSLDHHLYAAHLKNGTIEWKYKTKGRIRTTPVIWGNYLVAASEDDHIFVFQPNVIN